MAQKTSIEWTESTWNPVTGCSKISSGCINCYAERMANRLHSMGQKRYENNFKVTLQPDLLDQPKQWAKPRTIFVNSMSDLFHESVPISYIEKVFSTMNETPRHTYQILTKRASRLAQVSASLNWSKNIWMGVTVEEDEYLGRIELLKKTNAYVKFLSLEPLLGSLPNLRLEGISWVIVGGESGPGSRPIEAKWVRQIRDICVGQRIPFFFKQWGGTRKAVSGRELDGRKWDEYPI